MPGLTTL
jgi:hypothetical protein